MHYIYKSPIKRPELIAIYTRVLLLTCRGLCNLLPHDALALRVGLRQLLANFENLRDEAEAIKAEEVEQGGLEFLFGDLKI